MLFRSIHILLEEEAKKHLAQVASGDARAALNALELAVQTTETNEEGILQISLEIAEESIQQRAVLYDKDGDAHFDTISAFIKSMRGSDPDAALYWMAKMVQAGEDSRFLFRRMIIFASEDVGLADPGAEHLRIGLRLTREFTDDPVEVFNDFQMISWIGPDMGLKLINNFEHDFIQNKYYNKQVEICKELNIKPSKCAIFGIANKIGRASCRERV